MIGYQGYIVGVASENVFGTTYANSTYQSSSGVIPKGLDLDPHLKFQTTSGSTYIHHNPDLHETVSSIVGVARPQDTYKKVSKQLLKFKLQLVTLPYSTARGPLFNPQVLRL
jgi:hypothetical protein